ncbi:MAG: YicC family protein [Deltaproteobacteria bacterium]|nr:YicC family protein [Deltaproteobacteria bacterium]
MITSMTGFAQTVYSDKSLQITIAVRTYNNRFLDVNLRLNNAFSPLEDRIKSYIASRVSRGRVEVAIQLASQEKLRNGNLAINWELARTYSGLLIELKKTLNIPGPLALSDLLSSKDLVVYQETCFPEEVLWRKLTPPLKKVFDALQKMRSEEGRNLSRDLLERLKLIQAGIDLISLKAPQVIEAYQVRLRERIRKISQGVDVDPLRLAQEVAIMADRSDVSEELIRLESHLNQFKDLFKEAQTVGKKMEFLLQEMNREVNTIGSKAMDSAISHQVVSIKSELEKLREQVQNIE